MGGVEQGAEAVAWIKQFTRDTPLQIAQVTEAFAMLKNFGLDPMDGTMQAIVDTNSMLGGDFEKLRRISLALGQAWGKQKLQAEELRQLIEAGVPVWEILKKITGENVTELRKMTEQGKLGAEAVKGLIVEMGKRADGAALANMKLYSGLMSNLIDRWTLFKERIDDAGWGKRVNQLLTDFSSKWDEMVKNGSLQKLANAISNAFVSMADSVEKSLKGITFDEFIEGVRSSFEKISSFLSGFNTAFTVATNAAKLFFNAFSAGVKAWGAAISAEFYLIAKGLEKITGFFGAEETSKSLKGYADLLKGTAKAFYEGVKTDINDLGNALDGFYEGIVKAGTDANDKIKVNFKRNVDLNKKTIDELLGNYKEVKEAVEEVGDTATETFENAAAAMEQINDAETRIELASLGVTLAEALRQGVISQEEYYEATEASREKLKEFKEEADKTKDSLKDVGDSAEEAGDQQSEALTDATSIAGVMAGHYNTLTAELQGMSGAAHDAFVAMNGVGNVNTEQAISGIAELKSQLEETREELNKLQHSYTFDVTGISSWMNETAKNAAYVKSQYLQQKIALEELLESYEQGGTVARSFIRQGERAADTMNLLNNQDLDRLNNAIRSAEQSMDSLGESSRNTLNSLQDELDELQGRQSDIEQRRYQSQRDDLKGQQAEAIAKGDQEAIKNITSALRISEQVYNERLRQANNEKAKALQESQVSTSAPTTRTTQPAPQKIIRLEYPGGAVNVGIDSTDETKLLEALKNAGMRTV